MRAASRERIAAASGDLLIFENAEALAAVPGAQEQLSAALESFERRTRVCICTRVPLAIGYLRFALPHEVVVLDESALAFDTPEIEQYARSAGISASELTT
jgi:hypothetical protein